MVARAALAFDHPAQGDDDGERRHRRHHFLPDGDRQRADEAGDRAVARARRHAHEQDQRPDHQHDLHAVVMDRAGTEMLQHRRHQRGENQRDARRRVAGEFAREPQDAGKEHEQQRRRPQCQDDALGECARQQRLAGADQQSERQVDQARPMHHHAVRGIETILREIEPVLPGQKIAHLDQAHGVVGRHAVDAGGRDERHDRDAPDQQEQNPAFQPGISGYRPLTRTSGALKLAAARKLVSQV